MAHRPRPAHVEQAILEGNREELSRLGKLGNAALCARRKDRGFFNKKDATKLLKTLQEEKRQAELLATAEQANLDICPLDE